MPNNHNDHNDHDELAAAFAELRRHAGQSFTAPDTIDIFHAAASRTARTRRFSVTAALLAAGTLLAASLLLQPPPPAGDQEPLASGQAWTPAQEQPWAPGQGWAPPQASPQASQTNPNAANASRPDLANQVRFLSQQKVTQLQNTTLTLPPWPAGGQAGGQGGGQGCPAGTFTFHDGKTPTGQQDQLGRPYDYLMLYRQSLGIYANLDGAPGDEMVVPLACGFTEVTYQLLVLQDSKDGPRALAYLPALPAFDRFYPYSTGLVVEVLDNPFDTSAEQRRRYGWNGTGFTQTSGPASFPADLLPDVRGIDLRQSYFHIDQCGGGMLSFLDGVSGTWPSADHPATRIELGQISTGLLSEPPEFAAQGDALVTVTCKPDGRPWQVWVVKVSAAKAIPVLRVGDGGVTAVVSHRILGGLAEVTVRTQAGQQVWRFSSNGYTFTRIP